MVRIQTRCSFCFYRGVCSDRFICRTKFKISCKPGRLSFVFVRPLCVPLRLTMCYYDVRGGGMNSWKLCNCFFFFFGVFFLMSSRVVQCAQPAVTWNASKPCWDTGHDIGTQKSTSPVMLISCRVDRWERKCQVCDCAFSFSRKKFTVANPTAVWNVWQWLNSRLFWALIFLLCFLTGPNLLLLLLNTLTADLLLPFRSASTHLH